MSIGRRVSAFVVLVAAGLRGEDSFTYIRAGEPADAVAKGSGGAILLGGGKDVEEAFRWMIARSGGGDFLVLRARGTDAYNGFVMKLGGMNSAATLILRDRAASSDPAVLEKIRTAEAIFLAGGDQWNYVNFWKGTPLAEAVQKRIDAGVPVGGTSAGLAVLGQYYFSAEFDTIRSPEALSDPYHQRMAIGTGLWKVSGLEDLITDSHFAARDRMGRLVAFLARILQDHRPAEARGLGIDEATAVMLDPDGAATVSGKGNAYLLHASKQDLRCAAGTPLQIRGVTVRRFGPGERFHLRKRPEAPAYTLDVEAGTLRSSQNSGSAY